MPAPAPAPAPPPKEMDVTPAPELPLAPETEPRSGDVAPSNSVNDRSSDDKRLDTPELRRGFSAQLARIEDTLYGTPFIL